MAILVTTSNTRGVMTMNEPMALFVAREDDGYWGEKTSSVYLGGTIVATYLRSTPEDALVRFAGDLRRLLAGDK